METNTITNKQLNIKSQKLGFTLEESADIVVNLKQLLANYTLFYHKLRNYHWNVEGPEFFELHEEFENEYTTVVKNIDTIAERMRVFNIKPMLSISQTMELATIKDLEEPLSATAMVSQLIKDYELLHNNILDLLNSALNAGDVVTEQIATDLMRYLEKRNWMFSSWCK